MVLEVESLIIDVEIQKLLNGYNVEITSTDFETWIALDTEENLEFQAALMEEAGELLEEQYLGKKQRKYISFSWEFRHPID